LNKQKRYKNMLKYWNSV